jgi:2-hydroxychromene-2-carboxylate isomerase
MSSPRSPIRFYFDYISSNAYLAWVALPKLAAKYNVEIDPVPVLFAGLLEAHGQLGPAEIPAKSFWMWKNNMRKAVLLGVPLKPPAYHPFNPLLALRVSSLPMSSDERTRLVDGLFKAVWVEQLHVSEPAVVVAVADAAGLNGERLVAEAQRPESKARLRARTDQAIAEGVFGVPTMVFNDDLFWGYDDLPYLELLLAGRDPLSRADLPNASPRPSAARRRFRSQ